MILPVPRTEDEISDSLAALKDSDQRMAYIDSILALAPAHRASAGDSLGVMWTNRRGLWVLTVNLRDVGYQNIVEITMPLRSTKTAIPLPDHDVDYVRAMLVILGAIDPA